MLLPLPDNACNLCGRRAKAEAVPATARNKTCTGLCVKGGLGPRDYAIESALLQELGQRPLGTTWMLEEVLAGQVSFADTPQSERARNAARRLAARGQLEVLQDGSVIRDGNDSDGPIEVRLPRA